jgi:hypothetical protein
MALNQIELLIVFYLFLLIKLYSCIVVFPFKTIENKFDNIDYNSEEYNSTHFLNEYYNKLLYTKIKIGEPSQDVNTIIIILQNIYPNIIVIYQILLIIQIIILLK